MRTGTTDDPCKRSVRDLRGIAAAPAPAAAPTRPARRQAGAGVPAGTPALQSLAGDGRADILPPAVPLVAGHQTLLPAAKAATAVPTSVSAAAATRRHMRGRSRVVTTGSGGSP